MPYQEFPIIGKDVAQYEALEPWIAPEDTFREMENAYIRHGRILTRKGYAAFSRLETKTAQLTHSGDAVETNFTGNITGKGGSDDQLVPGSISIVADAGGGSEQTVTDDSNGNLTGDVDAGGTNTINYTTGAYDVTFAAAPLSDTDNITVDARYYRDSTVTGLFRRISRTGTEELIACDPDRLFVYQTGSEKFIDQLGTDTFTATSTDYVWAWNFDSWLALTNNVDAPQKWDGTTMSALGVGSTGLTKARLVVKYKGRLVYLNTVQSGSSFPQRALFSDIAAYETFTLTTQWVEADTEGEIVSAAFVGDDLVVFFDNPPSVWRLVSTGDFRAPFTFRQISSDFGGGSKLGTVSDGRRILTLGPTEFVLTDGNGVGNATEDTVPDYVLDNVDATNVAVSSGVLVPELDQAWISYVHNSDPNDVQTYVAAIDVNTGAVSTYTNMPFTVFSQFTNQTSLTWADFTGGTVTPTDTWESLTDYTWQDSAGVAGFPIILAGTRDGYVRKVNFGNTDNGTNITVTAKSQRLSPFKFGQARLGDIKLIATVATNSTVTVRLYRNYEGTPYQTSSLALDGSNSKLIARLLVNRVAEFHTIELESTNATPVQIDAIIPAFAQVGRFRKVA